MRFNEWIALTLAALAACITMAFAYQKGDLSGIKPQSKPEQAGQVEFITPEELKAKIAKNEALSIVDLRGQTSYEQSDKRIKGSLFSRVRKVAARLRDVPRDREIVTYCACPEDAAAILGAKVLLADGFKRVRVLKGGWDAWLKAGGQVEPKPRL
jgi:rhodanese-related sulfurtransferase